MAITDIATAVMASTLATTITAIIMAVTMVTMAVLHVLTPTMAVMPAVTVQPIGRAVHLVIWYNPLVPHPCCEDLACWLWPLPVPSLLRRPPTGKPMIFNRP